jgi:GTPase-activating protein SAC7
MECGARLTNPSLSPSRVSVKPNFSVEETILTFKQLIAKMPKPNQYLLLYVLDLLSVFAKKSNKNLMTASSR